MKKTIIAILMAVSALAAATVLSTNQVPVAQFAATTYTGLVIVDLDGTIHPATAPGLSVVKQPNGTWLVSYAGPVAQTRVLNETPQAAGVTWTLANAPTGTAAACYRNGVRQQPGNDYALNGNVITSAFWVTGDTLLCDYSY